jgi:peptidoglycan/LPS O-acetylase OafA/YrhL
MIILLAFYLFFAILLYFIARKKGRPPLFWAGVGFCFGPLALVLLLFSKGNHKGNKKVARPRSKRVA